MPAFSMNMMGTTATHMTKTQIQSKNGATQRTRANDAVTLLNSSQ